MRVRVAMGIGLLAAVLLATGAAMAQVNAVNLSGQVTDPSGGAVPAAKVTVRNLATGFGRTTETNNSGTYTFVALPPGRYELIVEKSGFAKAQAPELILTIGQVAEFNVQLRIQAGAEVIKIEEATELIETGKTDVSQTVDSRRITNLPINGRNYINFTLLTSQAQRDSAPSIGAAPTSGLNFQGQRARSNQVSVDGADAVDNSVNGIRATVSQEAVQEFQLIISNYMPEFGRATGGVVNIVTKGGSNEFHGNVFGYLRHKSIQARNPFSVSVDPNTGVQTPVKQPFTRVQAGVTMGGPIKKDKTFYFFSYETTRRQETGFTNIGTNNFGLSNCTNMLGLPTLQLTAAQCAFVNNTAVLTAPADAQGRTGAQRAAQLYILAGSSSSVALSGVDPGLAATVLFGLPTAPGNRFVNPIDCAPGGCMAANLVPIQLFGNCAATTTACFTPLRSVIGNYPISEGTSLWSARLDHEWNEKNNSFVRLSVSPSLITGIQVNAQNQNFGQNAGSRTSLQQTRDISLVTQHVTSFSNTVFNEARFQFARRGLHYGFSDLAGGSSVGVNMPGFAFFGREPFSTVDRIERRFQFTDNVTWIRGKHSIKTGVDVNLIQLRSAKAQIFELNFGGLYNFGGLTAGQLQLPSSVGGVATPGVTGVQAYGLGAPQFFIQGIGRSDRPFNNRTAAFFVQDSWKVHPRFTLNYGVRYDIELIPLFSPGTLLNQDAEPALRIVEGIPVDRNNWAPRIGVAWDPWGKGDTVIRAGYGIYYDHPLLAVAFNSTTAEGALSTQLIVGGATATRTPFATSPTSFNASSIFQGVLTQGNLGLLSLGYFPDQQRFDPKLPNSVFANQAAFAAGIPIASLPFTLHVAQNFKYGYSQQANLTVEQKFLGDYKLSVGYVYTHGLKLNRPRNINNTNATLLVNNFRNALVSNLASVPSSPFTVAAPTADRPATATQCGVTVTGAGNSAGVIGRLTGCPGPLAPLNGQVLATAAVFNQFRPTGPNPFFAGPNGVAYGGLVALAGAAGFPTGIPNIKVPFGDVDQQESSGNSVYHGLTVAVSKRFSRHFEFLSSYTWSHAIDDSTDLQTLLTPQDNNLPNLERSSSTFDQRHRWITSAVFESPWSHKDGGLKWALADWVVAPIFEVSSGRPFTVLTGTDFNLDQGSNTDRPSITNQAVPGLTAESPFIPGVIFRIPDVCAVNIAGLTDVTGAGCRGNLGRNAFTRPGFVQLDLRFSRKFYFTERLNLEFITDIFNVANKFNVADVSPLCNPSDPAGCRAGEPTAALDTRQFQFALKINW